MISTLGREVLRCERKRNRETGIKSLSKESGSWAGIVSIEQPLPLASVSKYCSVKKSPRSWFTFLINDSCLSISLSFEPRHSCYSKSKSSKRPISSNFQFIHLPYYLQTDSQWMPPAQFDFPHLLFHHPSLLAPQLNEPLNWMNLLTSNSIFHD